MEKEDKKAIKRSNVGKTLFLLNLVYLVHSCTLQWCLKKYYFQNSFLCVKKGAMLGIGKECIRVEKVLNYFI